MGVGGGDEDLLVPGQLVQDPPPTLPIHLGENVVQQQDRLVVPGLPQVGRLGQPEGQRQGAGLSPGGEGPHIQAVDQQPEVVPVGSDHRGGSGQLPLVGLGQLLPEPGLGGRQVVAAGHAGMVFQTELIPPLPQLGVVLSAQTGQALHHPPPPPGDPGSFPDQLPVPELHLVETGPPLPHHPQQPVAPADHLLASLKGTDVDGVGLGDEDVQVSAAFRRRAVDEVHVAGVEESGAHQSDQAGGGFPLPVSPDLLAD